MFSLYLIDVWVDHYYIHRVTITYIGSTIGETSEHSPMLLSSKLTTGYLKSDTTKVIGYVCILHCATPAATRDLGFCVSSEGMSH